MTKTNRKTFRLSDSEIRFLGKISKKPSEAIHIICKTLAKNTTAMAAFAAAADLQVDLSDNKKTKLRFGDFQESWIPGIEAEQNWKIE